jgi:FAD/FMN-containing dehydrogenase
MSAGGLPSLEIRGRVLLAGEPGYAEAVAIDNGRVTARPSMVVQPRSVDDVRRALAFARRHRLHATVKGGGHGAAGYCLNAGGLVIDMGALNAVEVDASDAVIRVQAGARWRDVYRAVLGSGTGLIPVGGGCADVGVAGFVLGGGYSFVSRSYGLGCDNVLALTIVTADGAVHRVSESAPHRAARDLFWACRGGGGGNFGVVVALELRAHRPPTPAMMMAELRYESGRVREVMEVYDAWVETVPAALAAYGIWRAAPERTDRGQPARVFGFTVVYNGDPDDGRALLAPLLALEPCTAQFQHMSLPAYEMRHGTETSLAGARAYIRAGVMPPRGWTGDAIDALAAGMVAAPSPDCFVVWTHAGGRIGEVASDATAFPHRAARYIPQVKAVWRRPDDAATTIAWAHRFFDQLGRHFVGGYVNYIDPLLPGWADEYYGCNHARLERIKREWDPGDFFRFRQSIGSRLEVAATEPLDLDPLELEPARPTHA